MPAPQPIVHRAPRQSAEQGIALILVMLALVVLSVLAAAIVFTARSETMASYNYKMNTQADYLAKAGIQQAINWFRSSKYQAVSPSQASSYYGVTSDGSVFNLYTANTTPVQCISGCPSNNAAVQLMGISGTSNYPNLTNAAGVPVATEFANDLVNVRVSGDNNDSGTFSVNAVLLNYQVVNTGTAPALSTQAVETWLITSRGTWTGAAGQNGPSATAVEKAIVQPIYTPTWGNALYGFCSVTMQGSSGVCTDAFNSAFGQYGGGNKSVASGACNSSSSNVIDSGAGVGANGSVTLGSNVTVAGNVTVGPGAAASAGGAACGTGYNGSTSSVLGEVVNGPQKTPPPAPTFRPGFPGSAPSYSGAVTLPVNYSPWPTTGNFPLVPPSVIPSNSSPFPANLPQGQPCMDSTCSGTAQHPYEISSISLSGGTSSAVNLIGGPDVLHPVYYDIGSLTESGKGQINVSGYVVLNVQTTLSITGQGITNGISGVVDIPPEAVVINFAGTSVSLGGNGAISALINAPNATVTVGGGGSKGYMVGSIQANSISVQGGYPIHYDLQLNRAGGTIGVPITTAYSRQKM
jgi:Tfp pilus assembly protein PilX